jgi:hypothetical protein
MSLEMWAAVLGLAVILPAVFVYNRVAADRHAVRRARTELERALAGGAQEPVVQYSRAALDVALQRYTKRRATFPDSLVARLMRLE